jgi:predicted DNA-binding transcriptional regulator YafY
MRRIERLINLIAALLDTRRPLTAEEIRTSISGYDSPTQEAFRRSFERDKKDLRDMGIPIETVKLGAFEDEGDGYIIPKEKYYMPELDLEPDELAALRLVADAAMVAGEDAQAGVRKLSIFATGESTPQPRIAVKANLTQEPLLGAAFSAVQARTPVTFTYTSSKGETSTRHLEPYSLTHSRGHWYLVGNDVDKGEVRSFRLQRIGSSLETGSGRYEIPEGFDALAKTSMDPWEVGGDEPEVATLRFDPALRWWAEQNLDDMPAKEGPHGSLEVEIAFSNVEALLSFVIGFGAAVEIVSPAHARTALLEHLAPYLESGA